MRMETVCSLAIRSPTVKVALTRLGAVMMSKRIRAAARRIQLPLPLLETLLFLAVMGLLAYS